MEEEVNFEVFHFFGYVVNHVRFAIPWKDLSFHNFVRRIVKECDPESRKLDLHFLSIIYINLEGDHVPLKWDEDEYRKFLDFVRRSKQCGYEYIRLIIPNLRIEKSKSDHTGKVRKMNLRQNALSSQELKDLFSLEIDCGKSFKNVEDQHTSFANIFLPQPRFPSTTAYQEQSSKREKMSPSYGMLDVKRFSEDDLPRLLADGSKILVATGDDNYLLMSFSKNDTYAPYNSFAWQNGRQDEPNFSKYRCQHVRVPACVENNGIRVSDESKNLIASLRQLDRIVEQRIQESEQSRSRDTCIQSQPVSQPEVIEQSTPEHRFQQHASFLHDPKFQNENNVPLLVESNRDHEEEIPAWFHRHLEKFKTDLVADVKKDLMESVKQMLLVHHGPPNTGHDTSLENEETTRESSTEDGVPEHVAKETKDDWEIVRGLPNDEIDQNFAATATAHCNDQLTKTDSDAVRDSEFDECVSVAGKSNCDSALDEFHDDSDSSVSIISDSYEYVHDDDDVSLDSESSFIRIPRCFVTQCKDDRESSPTGVPVRVKKHRKSKSTKSSLSTTESNISLAASSLREGVAPIPVKGGKLTTPMAKIEKPALNSSTRTEIDVETTPEKRNPSATVPSVSSSSGSGSGSGSGGTRHIRDCNCSSPSSSPPRKQNPKTSFSGGESDSVSRNGSEGVDRKNIESEKTQPLDILPDKVFEMTSNVFKNVLNSVKIPNSNGVKESMQKVFEESMSAASRLIPNPSLTGTIPLPPEDSNVAGRNAAVSEHTSPSTSASTSTSDVNASVPRPRPSVNDYVSRFHDLSDKMKADLALLNEMGFINNGHNLFLLTKYPDDMEKVIESLVNFTGS